MRCHDDAGEELKAKAEAFNAFYYPIEVDPHRTKEEKVPYMVGRSRFDVSMQLRRLGLGQVTAVE